MRALLHERLSHAGGRSKSIAENQDHAQTG